MLSPSLLPFLQSLGKNNNKIWMDQNRSIYLKEKELFEEFVGRLISKIDKFDAQIGLLLPKQCTFRINRDIRFSKDKSPYKTNFSAYFNKNGKGKTGAGYYLHVEPGKSFLAAGIWMPEKTELDKIRQEIDYNYEEWKHLINKISRQKDCFQLDESEKTIRAPKGYEENNPAIEFIKLKSFTVQKKWNNEDLLQKELEISIIKDFKKIKPLVDFINRALS